MRRGYVKTWRKSINSEVFQDPDLWKLWCLCLMKATYKERQVVLDGTRQVITISPGQFITGRFSLHREYYPKQSKKNVSPITLWRWLKTLENLGNLNIKTTNKHSVITINNWDMYQCDEQQMNNKRSTDDQQMITNKKVKKEKKKEYDDFPLFDEFYKHYPRKVSKEAAKKAWIKIKPDEDMLKIMISALEIQKTSDEWTKENGKFIPYPGTWLNNKRWEDETNGKGESEWI